MPIEVNTITYFSNKLKLVSDSGNFFIINEDNNDNGESKQPG